MKAKKVTNEEELKASFEIRKEVFVKEQGVPLEDEFDEFDSLEAPCDHLLVYYDDKPVGTGRLRVVDGVGKLERICIFKSHRQFGLGKEIIKALEQLAIEKGISSVKLHGQTQAEGFYQKLGYETSSDVFMEDGIPHVLMTKKLHNS